MNNDDKGDVAKSATTESNGGALPSLGAAFCSASDGDQTAMVMDALRGVVQPMPEMVVFLEYAATDAEDYGDFSLAVENRKDADRMRQLLSQNAEVRDAG